MRGMSPFLFVKLVQQRRTQNHAKSAHRVRRSSGQPFTGTTRSAGGGGVGLALAILVGFAKNGVAAFLYISCQPFFTTLSLSSPPSELTGRPAVSSTKEGPHNQPINQTLLVVLLSSSVSSTKEGPRIQNVRLHIFGHHI